MFRIRKRIFLSTFLLLFILLEGLSYSDALSFWCNNCNLSDSDFCPLPNRQKGWALAAGALTLVNSGWNPFVLPSVDNEYRKQRVQNNLKKSWGIYNKQDALSTLNGLMNKSHSFQYETLLKIYNQVKDKPDVLDKLKAKYEFSKFCKFQEKYGSIINNKSLKAWDLCRFIAVSGWCHAAGYLDEQEAWDLIIPVAQELQTIFDSWEEMGTHYLIGRQFWLDSMDPKDHLKYQCVFMGLVNDYRSPWKQFKWDENISSNE